MPNPIWDDPNALDDIDMEMEESVLDAVISRTFRVVCKGVQSVGIRPRQGLCNVKLGRAERANPETFANKINEIYGDRNKSPFTARDIICWSLIEE